VPGSAGVSFDRASKPKTLGHLSRSRPTFDDEDDEDKDENAQPLPRMLSIGEDGSHHGHGPGDSHSGYGPLVSYLISSSHTIHRAPYVSTSQSHQTPAAPQADP